MRRSTAEFERELDRLREKRAALVAPPRPISPAWAPVSLLLLILFAGSAFAETGDADLVAVAETTTTSTLETTTSTSMGTTSTSLLTTTTTTADTTTTLEPIAQADIIFAPPSPGPSGDPTAQLVDGAEVVTVASITDGDTLNLNLSDGSVEPVRLIGIHSPDANECWASEAGRALASLTPVGGEIGVTSDVSDRDDFDRLLRYLWVGGMSVNEEMVRRGAAIARRYPPDTSMSDRFAVAQVEAKEKQLGLWAPDACGPPANANMVIIHIEYDPAGDDNQNLNEEWIRIRNSGDNLVGLTGWGIRDESASNRFDFPTGFSIAPGETVTVHSGCGDNFGTTLFWCSVGSAIWNNDGDTGFLTDPNGNTHDDFVYRGTTTTTASTTTTTQAPTTTDGGGNCDPSYPDVCIPPRPPDLNCGDISHRNFTVVGSDPHGFDGDNDGIGCES